MEFITMKNNLLNMNTRVFSNAMKTLFVAYYGKRTGKTRISFSRATKKYNNKIEAKNLLNILSCKNNKEYLINSFDANTENFLCNIQQLHITDFDIIYFSICFNDVMYVFRMNQNDISNCEYVSNSQHKDNVSEKQILINNKNFKYFCDNYLFDKISYETLLWNLSKENSIAV